MSEALVRRWKWHWTWQDEAEEAWLRAQARQGLHLVDANVFGFFRFRRGPGQDVVYRLDFNQRARHDPSYRALFEDAGWEHALSCMGWEYWRKPAGGGRAPEIFTDPGSKIEKNKRLLGVLVAANVPNLINLAISPAVWHPERFSSPWTHGAVVGLMAGLALVSAYAVAHLWRRIRQLRATAA